VAEPVTQLFDEWAACFARGERPDLRVYLARAGDGSEELAALVDAWLARIDPPEPDEDAVALAQAWIDGEPPILELRRRRGLKRAQVVDFIVARFGLDNSKRPRVKRYYHEVESGELVPANEALVAALAELLHARAADLFAWKPRPLQSAPAAYFRSDAHVMASMKMRAPIQEDDVDRLFRSR
jgi:hypothetical protein